MDHEEETVRSRKLGSTGLEVSELCLGCWPLASDLNWGEQDERNSIAAVHAALDAGINFFDNAEMYTSGQAEIVLGKALKGRRDKAVVATKVHRTPMTAELVKSACEASLQRLQTDYVDLYLIHYVDHTTPMEETLAGFAELKRSGKIRAIGVCNAGVQDLAELTKLQPIVANQVPYSLIWRAIEYKVTRKCKDLGVDILCYSPLMMGLLTGKFATADEVPDGRARTRHFSRNRPHTRHGEEGAEQETFATIADIRRLCEEAGVSMIAGSLRWLLRQQGVCSVLVGARNAEQVAENAAAAEADVPTGLLDQLTQATESLKAKLGENPDPWQSQSRFR